MRSSFLSAVNMARAGDAMTMFRTHDMPIRRPRDAARLFGLLVACLLAAPAWGRAEPKQLNADVCVYGATPSGILAAVAVRRGGSSVVIVEPSRWVGGILGAGLKPTQDCPNINATGGLTRTLLGTLGHPIVERDGKRIREHVSNREMNPEDVRADFRDLLEKNGIRVVYEHRVSGCRTEDATVRSATFDCAPFDDLGCPVAEPTQVAALRVVAKVFIDASYDADLLARVPVSYRVGREAAGEYDEEQAGVQPPTELTPIDPFVEAGNPDSGLLPWVENDHGKPIGAADGYTQAYNYRYYTTDDPRHRIEFTPPDDYDASEFELVGRYVEYLTKAIPEKKVLYQRLSRIFPGWNNSGVWNYHRDSLFSMAPVGISQVYADGDYAQKARIWKTHQDYLRGLHHFMSTDSRVPVDFRKKTATLGLDGRHHDETHGWPHQLYVRVSRRLVGRYTITAHDVYNRTTVDDPIGLAQYGIDTYPSRRIWMERDGQIHVGLEGKMFIGGAKGPTNVPYPIPYRAITPRTEECTNLLVPVCFSATHLGYASARMEPVFMICGESAGIAACRALAEDTPVQQINMQGYRDALEEAGQVLEWTEERAQASGERPAERVYTFGFLCKTCDTDQDQLVSQREWGIGKKGWSWLFSMIDTSEDGYIDRQEYEAFQDFKRENPNWRNLRPEEDR
ncbi:MAG: FAD-dependent oxidoreductase [Planctomycetota bacterium]